MGPKFTLSRTVNKRVIEDAEIGFERGAFALRWRHFIESKQAATGKDTQRDIHKPSIQPDNKVNTTNNQTSSNEEADPENHHENDNPPDPSTSASALIPRFSDTDTKMAPAAPQPVEHMIRKLKQKILTAYKTHKTKAPNHTKEEKLALEAAREDSSVIFKPSDKCKGLVIMPKQTYIDKVQPIVAEYEHITKNPTPKLEAMTKRVIHETMDNVVHEKVIKNIIPNSSRTAELYGLPKNHKANVPLRPIVSACGDPLDKLSWFLERIITQLLPLIPAHLKNTEQYLSTLKNKYPDSLPPGAIVFTMDVQNLYGNVPTDEAITAVCNMIHSHKNQIDLFGITLDDLRTLLQHCLQNNYVRFGTEFYKQTKGIAMGSRVAPPIAITFMHTVESLILSSPGHQPVLYLRYIDDILGVWTHGADALDEYHQFINSFHPSLKFSLEKTNANQNSSVPFLDTRITVTPAGQYSTELYFKPMASPIIIHFTSAQPIQVKLAVLHSELTRAKRTGSNDETIERGIQKVTQIFLSNGYPLRIIKRAIFKVKNIEKLSNKQDRDRQKNTTFISLPFIDDDLSRRINVKVRSSGLPIKIAWQRGQTTSSILVHSALNPPKCPSGNKTCNACAAGVEGKCTTKNVVYEINCMLCQVSNYIGETKRLLRLRFNEHLRDAKNKTRDTPFGDHMRNHHSDDTITASSLHIRILRRCKDVASLKITESKYIRDLNPKLNTQTSSWKLIAPPPYGSD